MLKVRYSARFKKDFKLVQKRGCDTGLFEEIVLMLCNEKPLPPKNNDHALSGNYSGTFDLGLTPEKLNEIRKAE